MAVRYRRLPPINNQEQERFWDKVNKLSGQGPNGDCWEWQGNRPEGRYGMFYIRPITHPRKAGRGHNYLAHRVAYYLQTGDDPFGLHVNHHCDNPVCVRIDHLWKGTPKENTLDAKAKGRLASGERSGARKHPESYRGENHWSYGRKHLLFNGAHHGHPKLTEDAVRRIRAASGSQLVIGKEFGISRKQVGNIKRRKSWGWVE